MKHLRVSIREIVYLTVIAALSVFAWQKSTESRANADRYYLADLERKSLLSHYEGVWIRPDSNGGDVIQFKATKEGKPAGYMCIWRDTNKDGERWQYFQDIEGNGFAGPLPPDEWFATARQMKTPSF